LAHSLAGYFGVRGSFQRVGNDHGSGLRIDGEESAIEEGVEVSSQKQAI